MIARKVFEIFIFSTEKVPFRGGTREAGMEREDERETGGKRMERERGILSTLRAWSKHRLPSSANCKPSSAIAPSSVSFISFFCLQCLYPRRMHNTQCAN